MKDYKSQNINKILIVAFVFLIFVFTAYYSNESKIYPIVCMIYAGIVILIEWKENVERRKMSNEAKQIDRFLSEVRHKFYIHGMADEAVFDAEETVTDLIIKKKIQRLCAVLKSEDYNREAEKYRKEETNRYLKLFLTICLTVMEFGDKKVDGYSMFLMNLMNLKYEMRREQMQKKRLFGKMSGMTMVAVIPAFFLKLIQNWGVSNLPELEEFYQCRRGRTIAALAFSVSVLVFFILNLLKEQREAEYKVHAVLSRLEKNKKINRLLHRLEARTPVLRRMAETALDEAGENMNVRQLYLMVLLGVGSVTVFSFVYLIWIKINEEEGISIIFFISVLFIVGLYPIYKLQIKKILMRITMEEEVLQYHSIIVMLMYVEKIAVYEILESLEQFSVIFRRSISNCLNSYHSGNCEALEELRVREGCEAFRRLVDQFIMCDEIGVRQAFDEIKADRIFYQQKQDQQAELTIGKKILVGQFLAFIPMIFTVSCYLIIPFAGESIGMLTEVYGELQM